MRWPILEKMALAIMATLERFRWMAAKPDGLDLYTDPHNSIFIFDLLSLLPDFSASAICKVLR